MILASNCKGAAHKQFQCTVEHLVNIYIIMFNVWEKKEKCGRIKKKTIMIIIHISKQNTIL